MTLRFARLGITPNAVSLLGMAFGILAAFAYYHYRDLKWAIAGFVLMIAWHVMDGADGQLARLTNAQSELGKILDGICDGVGPPTVSVNRPISPFGRHRITAIKIRL